MKHIAVFLTVIGFCFSPLLNAEAQQRRSQQPSSAKIIGWTITIVEATQPEKIDSSTPTPSGNQKWLVLEVEMNVSNPPSFIPVKQIKVHDAGGVYPALAIADKAIPLFIFFKSGESAVFSDPSGKAYLGAGRQGKEVGLLSKVEKVSNMLLLFAVPSTAKSLYLQIGRGARIPVKLSVKEKDTAITQTPRLEAIQRSVSKPTQTYNGLEITILSADLVTKADNRECPPENVVITIAPLGGTPVARIA